MVDCTGLENRRGRKSTVGSNPTSSATCPRESVLPIRLRPVFSVVFEGYAGGAEHWPLRREARKRSLRAIFSGPVDCAVLVNSLQASGIFMFSEVPLNTSMPVVLGVMELTSNR